MSFNFPSASYPSLCFPEVIFQWQVENDKRKLWDAFRKKWIVLTPEEWVRQHLLHYLTSQGYPPTCMQVERMVTYNGINKRFDVLIRNRQGHPWLLIECKAPQVPITQAEVYQIAAYNNTLKAPYLCLTNGIDTYLAQVSEQGITALEGLPRYE